MRKKIGELLVEAGAVTAQDVQVALGHQRARGGAERVGEVLISMGAVTHENIARALSHQYDLPFIDLPQIPSSVSSLVPIDFQARHLIIPFKVDSDGRVERLHVAVADPTNLELVDELRFQLGKPLRVFVAAKNDIEEVLSALAGDALVDVDPMDIDEDTGDISVDVEIDRGNQSAPPGGYFTPSAPSPAAPPPPHADVPLAADLPDDWDTEITGVFKLPSVTPEAPAASNELDALMGANAQPLTRPALPPPPSPASSRPAEVVKFAKTMTPSGGIPVSLDDDDGDGPPRQSRQPPTFGGAAAPTAPRFTAAGAAKAPKVAPGTTVSPVTNAPEVPAASSPPPPSNLAPPSIAAVPAPPAPATATPPPASNIAPASPAVSNVAPASPAVSNVAPASAAASNIPPAPPTVSSVAPPPAVAPMAAQPPALNGHAAAPAPEPKDAIDFTEEDLAVLENLERLANGQEPTTDSAKVKPAQMVASLIRLLMKKGVIGESEFLEELARK